MRQRLDQYLVASGRYATRSRAADAVRRGCIAVNGEVATRLSMPVVETDRIETADFGRAYVSRAALKLKAGLEASGYCPAGRIALDLGASTGGFTQLLLEEGAAKVWAVDVGHGQMHPAVRADARVRLLEGVNARDLAGKMLDGERPQFLVADLSFISLRLALPPALQLAVPGAKGIFLVKPQFELGPDAIGKGGLVRDESAARQCADEMSVWLSGEPGWRAEGVVASPIAGGSGNREWLLYGFREE